MAAALEIVGLGRRFHRTVLDGLDLSVAPGRRLAILGASGSGKTTLLRLICGFERPSAGTIAIDGRPVAGGGAWVPPEHRRIGYVAQDGALFPHLTVAQNVLFGLRPADRTRLQAERMLRLVGLPADYAARPPQELSGGEQQRVALARALAPGPRLVLLDEPFSALDAALRVETRRAVLDALRAAGATSLLVTHDQGEALSIGDEVAVLREGRLVQIAAPAELYRHPVDRGVARFVGEAVLLPGVADGAAVTCALGRLRREVPGLDGASVDGAGLDGASLDRAGLDGEGEVLIRPEQISLLPAENAAVTAIVAEVIYYGHDASVRLRLEGGGEIDAVTARVTGQSAPAVGERRGIGVQGAVVWYPRG